MAHIAVEPVNNGLEVLPDKI